MKHLLLLAFLMTATLQYAQETASTEKFIRILGIAEKTIESNGMKIDFSLTEIAANEYQQIRGKSIEEVNSEFSKTLAARNIDPSKIEENRLSNLTKSKYGKVKTEQYSIVVKNEDEAKNIASMTIDGFKVTSVDYLFPDNEMTLFDEMAISAIKDAKRKAENIAKAVNKSIGQILNIEDIKNLNSTNKSSKYGTKTSTKTLKYSVNVTFELN